MVHAGDVIENPVTGERIVFHETSRETSGEAVVFETFVQPDGFAAAAHVHPKQEERFEVVSGTLALKVGDEEIVADPGDVVRLPFPPALVQRIGLALGAPLGRFLGYRPTYVPTAEPLAATG